MLPTRRPSRGTLTRPGHVFPLRYRDRRRAASGAGHTEAAVDLARLAGLTPAGVLVRGRQRRRHHEARRRELREFADEHGLTMISIEQTWSHYRRRTESHVRARRRDPAADRATATSRAFGYRITVDGSEHVALVYGDRVGRRRATRARRACTPSASPATCSARERCDCGPQLDEALDAIVEEGRGVVVYLRGHEGRGIGLLAKLQAYQLQDGGRDTVDANLDLGLPADARALRRRRRRSCATSASRSVRLLTNNPDKTAEPGGATASPVTERVPLTPRPNDAQPAATCGPSATGWATSCGRTGSSTAQRDRRADHGKEPTG